MPVAVAAQRPALLAQLDHQTRERSAEHLQHFSQLANLETEVLLRPQKLSHLFDTESLSGRHNRRRFIEIAAELTEVSRRNQLPDASVSRH